MAGVVGGRGGGHPAALGDRPHQASLCVLAMPEGVLSRESCVSGLDAGRWRRRAALGGEPTARVIVGIFGGRVFCPASPGRVRAATVKPQQLAGAPLL